MQYNFYLVCTIIVVIISISIILIIRLFLYFVKNTFG